MRALWGTGRGGAERWGRNGAVVRERWGAGWLGQFKISWRRGKQRAGERGSFDFLLRILGNKRGGWSLFWRESATSNWQDCAAWNLGASGLYTSKGITAGDWANLIWVIPFFSSTLTVFLAQVPRLLAWIVGFFLKRGMEIQLFLTSSAWRTTLSGMTSCHCMPSFNFRLILYSCFLSNVHKMFHSHLLRNSTPTFSSQPKYHLDPHTAARSSLRSGCWTAWYTSRRDQWSACNPPLTINNR